MAYVEDSVLEACGIDLVCDGSGTTVRVLVRAGAARNAVSFVADAAGRGRTILSLTKGAADAPAFVAALLHVLPQSVLTQLDGAGSGTYLLTIRRVAPHAVLSALTIRARADAKVAAEDADRAAKR